MSKKTDPDKGGISTGTKHITPMGPMGKEFSSSKKAQKPQSGGTQSVSRGQKIKS